MGKNNATIHDHFIRAILADKEIAREYFRNYLPSFVSNLLDLSTLTQLPDTYLSKNLRKTMSDIIYTCNTKNGEDSVRVSLLIEHKSYADKYTPIQIGSYIFSGLEKQLANKEKLSIIIPVLLYHGKENWQYATLSDLFENIAPYWKKFLPDFDYVYNDLSAIPDKDVEGLKNRFLAASVLSLKHTYSTDWLERNAYRILILSEEASKNLQQSLIVYLFGNSELDEDQIVKLMELFPSKLKHSVMTTLEIFEKKGLDKGLQYGLEKGLEKGKESFVKNLLLNTDFSVSKIAMLSEVTEEFVIKMQQSINLKE